MRISDWSSDVCSSDLATAKLVQEVPWTEAKYYGATQVIDEARHVEAYARYLDEKLELTYPCNDNLRQLLELVIADTRWRSEERRVGKEWVSTCRSRCEPYQ